MFICFHLELELVNIYFSKCIRVYLESNKLNRILVMIGNYEKIVA